VLPRLPSTAVVATPTAPRTRATHERTLEERGDPRSVFSAKVVVTTWGGPHPRESAKPTP
jgi:hypothetical protein